MLQGLAARSKEGQPINELFEFVHFVDGFVALSLTVPSRGSCWVVLAQDARFVLFETLLWALFLINNN